VCDWGVRLASADVRHEARGFDYVAALSSSGSDVKEVDAVDYLFELIGDWKEGGSTWEAAAQASVR
jgi:hypothetical protein